MKPVTLNLKSGQRLSYVQFSPVRLSMECVLPAMAWTGIATGADITRGLPRAEELFEARKKLKDPEAIFSEVEGFVKDIASDEKGRRKLFVETEDGKIKEYDLSSVVKPKISIGDKILKGESLTTGTIRPRKLMEKLGVIPTAFYLLREIKQVYAEQGVEIHDKHFELIIRQMLSMVEVTDPGDTDHLPGDLLSIQRVREINKKIYEANKRVDDNKAYAIGKRLSRRILVEDDEGKLIKLASENDVVTEELLNMLIEKGVADINIYDVEEEEYQKLIEEVNPDVVIPEKEIQIKMKEPLKFKRRLLRITKASLESEGWLSAASFQQTPQVLTESSVEGKVDYLLGLKENVIVGQLIPAGTGLDMYANIQVEETPVSEFEEETEEHPA